MRRESFKIYQERIKCFLSDVTRDLFDGTIPLEAEYFSSHDHVPFAERLKYPLKKISEGEVWGEKWSSAWFKLTGRVPEAWAGKKIVARLNISGEGLIFSDDGVPLQGITAQSIFVSHYSREIYSLCEKAKGGETFEFWCEGAANDIFGIRKNGRPALDEANPHGTFDARISVLQLCAWNEEMWQLSLDIGFILSMLEEIPENNYRCRQLVSIVNDAINVYAGNRDNAAKCRAVLKKILSAPANASALKVTAVGHAHIDTGWLWPVKETIRKCGRTFSNQIGLIEKYPDYVFGASQPQHYAFTKERYPALYEKIKKYVKKGRWEPQGGMWVEADCNIISGESMIRQFIHGKNFFMDEFGFEVKNLWIPDVFGYSAAMPQIIRKCRCEYFLTQKISWNQINKFPHNTFIWRGVDGSEVLTHFPPEDNYNSFLMPKTLISAQNNFIENDSVDEFISLFGVGDGGGGPKEENIENGLRQNNIEGCPKLSFGRADDFFKRLEKFRDKLELWSGELYLESHRGTLTTQARVKKANRLLEYRLKTLEFLYSCLPLPQYPAQEFDKIWKVLLINQFHDIIPGSSITEVYQNTLEEYRAAFAECDKLMAAAGEMLFEKDSNSLTLMNVTGVPYSGAVELPDAWTGCNVQTEEGKCVQVQTESGRTRAEVQIPAYGFLTLKRGSDKVPAAAEVEASGALVLENDLVRYEFNRNAELISAYDKEAGRQILQAGGKGNALSLYVDEPNNYDAWDVDLFYEKQQIGNAAGTGKVMQIGGPVRNTLNFELKIGNSCIKQQIVLGKSKRLDFNTAVEWKEAHKMLRTAFPVNVMSQEASFDIQYAYAKRPTTRNNSWELAKFEVVAHRYADISDLQYGVALLNNCKYGHKVHGSTLDLNLLRSPKYPDFNADIGRHEFTYSLLPHQGQLTESNVIAEAVALNSIPLLFNNCKHGPVELPCRLSSSGISLEVLKKAEKEDCLVIRLVETQGKTSSGILYFSAGIKRVAETDMLEWENLSSVEVAGSMGVELKPFEIRTCKLLQA